MSRLTIICCMLFMFSCEPRKNISALEDAIKTELSKHAGTFAVAFKDLHTGDQILISAHENFHAASTMKTPVMIEVFKQASEGRFTLNDSIAVKNEFSSIVDGSAYSLNPEDDSEHELYRQIGKKRRISDLVYDMIIASSNLATNLVIELVDAKRVTETMRQLGASDILVLRGVEDSKAFEKGMNNTTTAYGLMIIFEKLAREELVSKEASREMTRILLDQRFNDIIPAKLPGDVQVAHKTGNISGVQHDSGIVFLPDGKKYVLVLLSKGLVDENEGKQALATVSEKIHQYVSSSH